MPFKMEPFDSKPSVVERWFNKPLKELKVKDEVNPDTGRKYEPVEKLEYTGESKVYYPENGNYAALVEEIRKNGDYPNDEKIVTSVNAAKKQAAKAKVVAALISKAGLLEPTAASDPLIALKQLYSTLSVVVNPTDNKRIYTENGARRMAQQFTGATWPADIWVDDGQD